MTRNRYKIRFDYLGGADDDNGNFISDPPKVIITQDGYDYIEVYEDPEPKVKYPDCDDSHWEIPPNALKITELLNDINL